MGVVRKEPRKALHHRRWDGRKAESDGFSPSSLPRTGRPGKKPHPMASLPELRLRVRVRGRHPWFFRGMVRKPKHAIPAGAAVRVVDSTGQFVGTGFYNPRTEKALRMLSREEVSDPDALLVARVRDAIHYREKTLRLPDATDVYRMVHSEGDRVPGLILDRLGRTVVAQVFSLAVQQRLEPVGEFLLRRDQRYELVLTVDDRARKLEGMQPAPPARGPDVEVQEHGIRYGSAPGRGHKTGFFADQRDNRLLIGELAKGRRVLDLCCNGGGFALHAARGGAREVVAIDLDEEMVARTADNARRNRLRLETRHGDAFDSLRELEPGAYDLLILDPPKWAESKTALADGSRRYRDLNRLAFAAAKPGTLILTCSCSGVLSEDAFLRILREAAVQAGVDVAVRALRGAGPDHPIALEVPETRYLKAVLLEVRG